MIIEILDFIGYITIIFSFLAGLWAIYLWFRGILPAIIRLGYGLAIRKIAIFASTSNGASLEALLTDSTLISAKNITHITTQGDLKKAENQTLYLVYWPDWKKSINKIVQLKKDGTALVIYAPQEEGSIPKEMMTELNMERNVIVTNFRGRLLNDIVVSMITTGYEK